MAWHCLESHHAREIWKGSFIPTVRPTIHTNPSRKRSFLKMISKRRNLKTLALCFSVEEARIFARWAPWPSHMGVSSPPPGDETNQTDHESITASDSAISNRKLWASMLIRVVSIAKNLRYNSFLPFIITFEEFFYGPVLACGNWFSVNRSSWF